MANEPDSPAEAPTVELGSEAPKDSFDEVLRRVVTVDSRQTLAPGSVIANRFKIERMLGAGGMGTVYVARDESLARDVAIKLHHITGGGQRLRREAMAMARLAHPNVVTVFEVGELDRHPFVVMEYIDGTTLRAWLAERPRTVREILDMMIAAGEGLAAAHDAGLLHRDFKPENVMIGTDGRPRVGDFGLARDLDSKDEPISTRGERGDRALTPLTQTGAVVGTPAYMAPEQLTDGTVDARADQFAFCITLWEALWKTRPFVGNTLEELATALESGTRKAVPTSPRVPARIRAAIERGLSPDPDRRYPSMRQLLAALRDPSKTRRRILAASGAGALVIAAGAWMILDRSSATSEEVSCTDAGGRIVELVPRDVATKLEALGAKDAAAQVRVALDDFATALAGGARTACERGRARREWSPALLEKSEACLEVAARTASALLAFDTVTAVQRPEIVRRAKLTLPDLSGCTSPTFLAARPSMPSDPAQVDLLIAALTDTAVARAELQSSRLERAKPYLDRLAASPVRDSPMIAPGVLVVRAMLARAQGDIAQAETQLSDAYYAARSMDDDTTMGAALTNLLVLAVEKSAGDPMAQSWLRAAVADAERLAPRAPWISARLFVAAATVAEAQNDSAAALRHVARARALVPAGDPALADGAMIEAAILLWTGKPAEGIALFDRVIAAESQRLGADHPRVGAMLADYAAALLDAGAAEPALVVAERAMAIIEKSVDPGDRLVDKARVNLGAVLWQVGEDAKAGALLETARAHYVAHYGVRSTMVANVDMNLALVLMGANETERAITLLEESLATNEQLLGPDRIEVAEVLFNLAVARNTRGDLDGAKTAIERCAAIYGAKRPGVDRHRVALGVLATIANKRGDHAAALAATATALGFKTPVNDVQSIALNQLERARALVATKRPAEAKPLLVAARATYESERLTARVADIDKLLARTR